MKLYVCGPMSHRPQFNIPAFDAAAEALRALGHEVINPAEEDSPAVRAAALASPHGDPADLIPTGETWGDMLARDVKIVADGIDGVVVLPGWHASRGARLEVFVALLCCKPIHLFQGGEAQWINPITVLNCLAYFTAETILEG